jgi:hypothetical protein
MRRKKGGKTRSSKTTETGGSHPRMSPSALRPRRPYIPQDQLTGPNPNRALAADILELTALLAPDRRTLLAELTSTLEIGQDEFQNVDDVIENRDRPRVEATSEIQIRARQLGDAYPFSLNATGSTLTFDETSNWGRTLYVLSLILSHLPSEKSPVLEQAELLPDDADIIKLRRWFQYCATASVAAEIGGDAWAFGWPRPDQSAFLEKLKEIWSRLGDGDVREEPLPGSPDQVKDDEIDIIAAKLSCDGLHGFPIILGQVASGHNWRSKPLRSHADHVFFPEWFDITPASQTLIYHIIPFVIEPTMLRRQTRQLGHLMHRVRLCSRALEAHRALQQGQQMKIEGTDAFEEVTAWTTEYRSRGAAIRAPGAVPS